MKGPVRRKRKRFINKGQKIFKEEYGKELTYEEAYEAAHNLVGFFDLLLKIDMRENPQKYTKKSNLKNSELKGRIK